MRAAVLALLVLAACDPPPLQINYLADLESCSTATCADIPVTCASWINVRVIRPSDPSTPVASFCQPITITKNLCSIVRNTFDDIETLRIPDETLQVQVSIWQDSDVGTDPLGNRICPGVNVAYTAVDGFPTDGQDLMPAIGGSSYVSPGEETVTVDLACKNVDELNSCRDPSIVDVRATVEDFDSRVSVEAGTQAAGLIVTIGEPTLVDPAENRYQYIPKARLDLDASLPVPAWSGQLDMALTTYACVNVLDDRVAQTTGAITCELAPSTRPYNLHGTRLLKDPPPGGIGLSTILAALGPLPGDGITVGVVLDYQSNPKAGASVELCDPGDSECATPAAGSVRYLSADLTALGGTVTSSNGVFVATNAVFGTVFRAANPAAPGDTAEKIGGGIDGRVTVVVLQLPPPPPLGKN